MVVAGVPAQACVVLGRAILWKMCKRYLDAGAGHLIPNKMLKRVTLACRNLGKRNNLPVNVNPVNRVNLGVSGIDAKVHVFQILGNDNVGWEGSANVRHKKGVANAEVCFLALEVAGLCRKNHNLREEMKRHDSRYFSEIHMLRKALQRLAAQSGRRMVPVEEDATISTSASVGGLLAKLC